MPNDLPVLHPVNITGSPATSGIGLVAALALQGATGGFVWPTDTAGWLNVVMSIAVFLLGLFVKQPGK